jgi:N-acetylmuramoyl-L-alanine amidase
MRTYISIIIVILLPIIVIAQQEQPPFVVVLDAGHGGTDPGKKVGSVNEKDIALKVVKLVGERLEKSPNVKVVYTRTTDVFLKLRERAQIANDAKADLFVSVHCNAAANVNAHGNETFVLGLHRSTDNLEVVQRENAVILLEEDYKEHYEGFDPSDPSSFATSLITQAEFLESSIEMAARVQNNFEKDLKRRNRGVKQAGFAVLRLSYMPSVLIETGFITNREERAFLSSNLGQKKVATAIYDAIKTFQQDRDINNFVVPEVEVGELPSDSRVIAPSADQVFYKVQIAAGSSDIAPKSYNFKKLPEISRTYINGVYRYYTGKTLDLESVQELKNRAIAAGYKGAFIVEVKNEIHTRL